MNKFRHTALILGSSLAIAGSAFAGVAFAGAGGGGCDKAAGMGRGAARFEEVDTDKDAKISLAELTTSREGWLTQIDTNKDGVATQAEIDASRASKGQARMQKMFEQEDANKDGRLTREETRLPSAWFEKADTNKDGALTALELTEARKSAAGDRHSKQGKGADHRQDKGGRFDQNGDGKVELREVRASAAEQFARLDANKDGNLSSDEFRTRRHGKHRRGAGPKDAPAASPAPVRS